MQRDLEGVTSILEGYMSNVNARALVSRALREKGLSATRVSREDLALCGPSLRRGIELFVPPAVRNDALRRLGEFFGNHMPAGTRRVDIDRESDISTARTQARRMCEQAGTSPFAMQKVTTIVSELARNIVLYAGRGSLEISFKDDPRTHRGRLVIGAVDSGPGIPNLEFIMSGRYQSRTGLGKGLLGTKRLADQFKIETGPRGTSIEAEVIL